MNVMLSELDNDHNNNENHRIRITESNLFNAKRIIVKKRRESIVGAIVVASANLYRKVSR